jgi:hypothetical protein
LKEKLSKRARHCRVKSALLFLLVSSAFGHAQTKSTSPYPKEIRGYKVERAIIEPKKSDDIADTELIKFGEAELARVTPLGISMQIPIVVAPVTQKGHVSFLLFEDMIFNGTPVEIDEYHRAFDLPNRNSLQLREPLRFYIYLPRAVLAGIDEWINSKERWPVTGRIYVCGKFRKGLFSFKRCVPVELDLTMRNPLKRQ